MDLNNYDIYEDELSDNESGNSSDEEFRNFYNQSNKDAAGQFEHDMNINLDKIIDIIENTQINEVNKIQVKERLELQNEYQNDTSDEEFNEEKPKSVGLTNDELFYDPNMDEMDSNWVNSKRPTYMTQNTKNVNDTHEKIEKVPNSDAVLNCPCCMSCLCMDCQRHEKYACQYRAMFVFNCKIDESELLKYAKEKKKSKKNLDDNNVEQYDEYYAVKCCTCDTKVGVYDRNEELYHFFNVLASH